MPRILVQHNPTTTTYDDPLSQNGSQAAHPQVPLAWVEMAAQLGTKALVVGILLQFRVLLSQKESVTLPKNFLAKFGIPRGVKQRALKNLEDAGLIRVSQVTGHSSRIILMKI